MKYYRLLNSSDGMIVEEVDGKDCKYCHTAFIYTDNESKLKYNLIDIDTGLLITRSPQLKTLEQKFNALKPVYEENRKTDAYKIKVERFEKLKLAYNYKGV